MGTNREIEILFHEAISAINVYAGEDCHLVDNVADDEARGINHFLIVGLALPPRHIKLLIHAGPAGTSISF